MKRIIFFFLLFPFSISAQYFDDFSDGNFNENPTWHGNHTLFQINNQFQLQTNGQGTGIAQIHRIFKVNNKDSLEWQSFIALDFSPSTSNFARIHLAGRDSLFGNEQLYIQLGSSGTTDAMELVHLKGGIKTILLSNQSGSIANSFQLHFKLTYQNGELQLFERFQQTQFTQVGTTPFLLNENWEIGLGIFTQYTASNSKKFFFDDTYIGPLQIDNKAPKLLNYQFLDNTNLMLYFNESCNPTSLNIHLKATPTLNFKLVWDTLFYQQLKIIFEQQLLAQTNLNFQFEHLSDFHSNDTTFEYNFLYEPPEKAQKGEVIITEIMFDPTPSNGLPIVDYLEIYNKSTNRFNLKNWTISDATSSCSLPDCWLEPKNYLVFTTTGINASLPNLVQINGLPNFNTEGDIVQLTDENGIEMERLNYSPSWYNEKAKTEGGFSIERIVLELPCTIPSNWKASCSSIGGTPGEQNCNYSTEIQLPPLTLMALEYPSIYQINMVFNQPITQSIDSMKMNLTPSSGEFFLQLNADPSIVEIYIPQGIEIGKVYQLSLPNLCDCFGKTQDLTAEVCIGFPPNKGQLIINEVLFNAQQSAEYVELFNCSEVPLNLAGLHIKKISSTGISYASDPLPPYTLKSNSFVYLSKDTTQVKEYFRDAKNAIQTNLPELSNDSGNISIHLYENQLDELNYFEKWHLPYYNDYSDKALERLTKSAEINPENNWITAASTTSFGTPGYKNAQSQEQIESNSETELFACIQPYFTPNGNGENDVLQFLIQAPVSGCLAQITIFDFQGNEIYQPLHNELIQEQETVYWKGETNTDQLVKAGTYIAELKLYHPEKKRFVRSRLAVECIWQ